MKNLLKPLLSLAIGAFATLAAADMGMLRIATDPGDAQIFINGQRKGNSPTGEGQTFAIKLPQGEHTVEARKTDGGIAYEAKKSVFVANDSLQTVQLKLEKLPTPYGNQPNGSVNKNGKEWLRCSLGQAWTGSSCAGEAQKYTFEQAQAAAQRFNATGYGGKRDWRVPTLRELAGLIVCSSGRTKDNDDPKDGGGSIANNCDGAYTKPTIDTDAFPNTPFDDWFWTSSPYVGNSNLAWNVNFNSGDVYGSYRNYDYHVRLVRASQ